MLSLDPRHETEIQKVNKFPSVSKSNKEAAVRNAIAKCILSQTQGQEMMLSTSLLCIRCLCRQGSHPCGKDAGRLCGITGSHCLGRGKGPCAEAQARKESGWHSPDEDRSLGKIFSLPVAHKPQS